MKRILKGKAARCIWALALAALMLAGVIHIYGMSVSAESVEEAPTIEGVTVTGVKKYCREEVGGTLEQYPAVEVKGALDSDTILYQFKLVGETPYSEPVSEMPKISNPGKYIVMVTVKREGFKDYVGKVYSEIKQIKAEDLTYNGENQVLVEVAPFKGDTVSYKVDGKSVGEPVRCNAGMYSVDVLIVRDDKKEYEGNFSVEIKKATIEGISVKGKELSYDGTEQKLVEFSGDIETDDVIEWTVDDEPTWTEDIPKGTDAGSYEVGLTVRRGKNYEFSDEVTTEIQKGDRTLAFNDKKFNHNKKSTEEMIGKPPYNKTYNFSATAGDDAADTKIMYSVSAQSEPDEAGSIDKDGMLTVKYPGVFTVTATLPGDYNYNECKIEHTLKVSGKAGDGVRFISFDNTNVEYILGESDVISDQKAKNVYEWDTGEIIYEMDDVPGVYCNDLSGELSVTDYDKLAKEIRGNSGTLIFAVKATKAPGGLFKVWGEDNAEYTVTVKFEETPETPEKPYVLSGKRGKIDGNDTEWFISDVDVTPALTDYDIALDEIGRPNEKFGPKGRFESGGNRYVYLRNKITKGITNKILVPIKIDKSGPDKLKIEILNDNLIPKSTEESFKFYNPSVKIIFTAEDEDSGIDHFDWKYTREPNASGTNLDASDGRLPVVEGKAKLKLTASEAAQYRGSIAFSATDRAGNKTEWTTDKTVFVVDTVSPTGTFSYSQHKNVVDGIYYYDGDVEFKSVINEANFYPEDVHIYKSKDGTETEVPTDGLSWEDDSENPDVHVCTYTVEAPPDHSGDGEYEFRVAYTDRSGNKMTEYKSKRIIVDTEAPSCPAPEYSEQSGKTADKIYFKGDLTAKFKIKEENFYPEDVHIYKSKDGTETEVPADGLSWEVDSENPDDHVCTYTVKAPPDHSGDGDYKFKVAYTDKSGNVMEEYISAKPLVIDTTDPEINVKYTNNDPVSTMQDRAGHQREYFDGAQTAVVTVTEHNFSAARVELNITAADVTGAELDVDALSGRGGWSSGGGDVHTVTITYPGDANYTFNAKCADLAANSAEYGFDYFTVDKTVPVDLSVEYSDSVPDTGGTGFYNDMITVMISADDVTSGIDRFVYDYNLAPDVSPVNSGLIKQAIEKAEITYSADGKTARAEFKIPKEVLTDRNQFNGTISFIAVDRSRWESSQFIGARHLIIDNIAPVVDVTYNEPDRQSGGVSYYDGPIYGSVNVNEANFYPEDVSVSVTKDGAPYPVTPNWTDVSVDEHKGTFTLEEDGDYVVTAEYTDKSGNKTDGYVSGQMTVDTKINAPVITVNGKEGDGKAFKDEVIPAVDFEDINFDSYEIKLTRTRLNEENVDVTERFVGQNMNIHGKGGSGKFDTFAKKQDIDGIYTLTVSMADKVGHFAKASITFTVNRFGSVYEYGDYLSKLIKDGGAYVQKVDKDFIVTEYNADRLLSDSLEIEISLDGKPLPNVKFSTAPQINERTPKGSSGWYQYKYTISKENFEKDGVYKVSISSKDATGNMPETANYKEQNILFRVDSTPPEINSVAGLEKSIINAHEAAVKYTVFDTIGLKSATVYIDGEPVGSVTDFKSDLNNYEGGFVIPESSAIQKIRIVVEDIAGNIVDTDAQAFESAFAFNRAVTVSTNAFVRFYANKALFWVTMAVMAALLTFCIIMLAERRKKKEEAEEQQG